MLSSRKEFSGLQGRTLHFLLAQTEDVFQRDTFFGKSCYINKRNLNKNYFLLSKKL